MSDGPDPRAVEAWLETFQDGVTRALEEEDGAASFREDRVDGPGGGSRVRIVEDAPVLERACVLVTRTAGRALPEAATRRRPELAGRDYTALSSSLIVHPRNPYAPTCHANFRFFVAGGEPATWWFGGGYDLTPHYGFEEDARHWHGVAREACAPFGSDLHPRLKRGCDDYFHLPHRDEQRGIGGVFFDDLDEGGFEHAFALWRAVGESFVPAYRPILARRKGTPYGERERTFQLHRRGRYVEFNLLWDRGTRFGIEAGGRAESILASMPPLASWSYDHTPEPGTPEARLVEEFLRPRDWLA